MHRIRRSVVALAAIAAGGGALAASAAAAPVQEVFSFTGQPQTWTAPTGVTEATFTLQGAAGGAGSAVGGFGAEVRATLPVTPGQSYALTVGGRGQTGPGGVNNGYNGGAAPGDSATVPAAGSAGGATDLRPVGGALASRLLVAAGGGGGGSDGILPAPFGAGGVGGAAGQSGIGGGDAAPSTGGGGGQTLGTGGTLGTGTAPGTAGGAGTLGAGGAGGAQAGPGSGAGGNGGGGGGGWTGGGGGGAGGSVDATTDGAGGGGGAGGQNFVANTAQDVTIALADQTTNGVAVVSYEPLAAPTIRTQPTLSGVAGLGRVLTCELGTWNGSPALTVAYLRNGVAIAGATNPSYTITTADVGQQISCQVTATNAAGTTVARTPAVLVPTQAAPASTVPPNVTGTSAIGSRLTCNPGTWSDAPTFAYQWLRNGVAISGATTSTYTARQSDAGQALQCVVRATSNGLTAVGQTIAVGGPARLVVLNTTALVSRSGSVSVLVGCFGPTACRISRVTVTAGQVIARAGARTVRSGASSRITFRLGKRGVSKLSRTGSSITTRFVGTPTGGYGGNTRVQFVALRGATLG